MEGLQRRGGEALPALAPEHGVCRSWRGGGGGGGHRAGGSWCRGGWPGAGPRLRTGRRQDPVAATVAAAPAPASGGRRTRAGSRQAASRADRPGVALHGLTRGGACGLVQPCAASCGVVPRFAGVVRPRAAICGHMRWRTWPCTCSRVRSRAETCGNPRGPIDGNLLCGPFQYPRGPAFGMRQARPANHTPREPDMTEPVATLPAAAPG